MISTFAGTFISTDRENDTSRSALTNRPALAYTHTHTHTHTQDEQGVEGVKWRMGQDKEDGEKRKKIQKGGGGKVTEEDSRLRMETDEGEEENG